MVCALVPRSVASPALSSEYEAGTEGAGRFKTNVSSADHVIPASVFLRRTAMRPSSRRLPTIDRVCVNRYSVVRRAVARCAIAERPVFRSRAARVGFDSSVE